MSDYFEKQGMTKEGELPAVAQLLGHYENPPVPRPEKPLNIVQRMLGAILPQIKRLERRAILAEQDREAYRKQTEIATESYQDYLRIAAQLRELQMFLTDQFPMEMRQAIVDNRPVMLIATSILLQLKNGTFVPAFQEKYRELNNTQLDRDRWKLTCERYEQRLAEKGDLL